jgi:putative ABC transport system permease protein
MMLDMAFKELGRHKFRTGLTILGIAIGILLVTSISSFSEGIRSMIDEEMAYISGMVVVLQEGTSWASFQMSEIDESIWGELEAISGVERVSGMVMGRVPGVGSIYGFVPDDLDIFEMDVDFKDGRLVEDGVPEIALGFEYAERTGHKVGDEISIRGKKYEVVGVLEGTGSEEDNGVIAGLETAQEILGKEGKVGIFMIKPVNVEDAEDIAKEINRLYDNLDAGTDEDARREAEEFTGQLGVMTFGMGSIAAIIAGLGMMNVMFMSVRERRREIGTMKALGATNYQVLIEVVLEAVIIALVGALIGILLSYVAVEAINTELGTKIAKITPLLLINVTLFAVFLGIFGGVLPARQASKLQPAVVLRYE